MTGENGSGENGTEKMVPDEMVYGQNGSGQNGTAKWYGQNGTILYFVYPLIQLNSI